MLNFLDITLISSMCLNLSSLKQILSILGKKSTGLDLKRENT